MAYGGGPFGSSTYGGGLPPTRTDIDKLILDRLIQVGGGNPRCPVCKSDHFTTGAFVPLPTAPNPLGMPWGVMTGQQVIPCISVTCQTCGNTLLVNLLVLGFDEATIRGWGYPVGPQP